MDFNFLGITNRVLQMAKQTYVSTLSGVTLGDDAYNVMVCVNDAIQDLSNILRIKTGMANFTITTEANVRTYAIPRIVQYPVYSLRQGSSDTKLIQMNTQEFDYRVPSDQNYGDPEVYYLDRYSCLDIPLLNERQNQTELSAAVAIASDSIQDNIDITIQGHKLELGIMVYHTETVSLSGTATVYTSKVFQSIEKIYKPATSGTVTFSSTSPDTAVTYGKLSKDEHSVSLAIIGLHPIPSSVMTISGRGWLNAPKLTTDNETPVGLDEMHINALTLGAYARYLRYDTTNKTEAIASAFSAYYDDVRKIVAYDKKDKDMYNRFKSSGESTNHISRFNPLDRSVI